MHSTPVISSTARGFASAVALAAWLSAAGSSAEAPSDTQPASAGEVTETGAAAPGTAATADEEFKEALQLYQGKDYPAALPKFRRVLELSGSPNARLYVARCLKEIGHLGEAYEEMDRTVKDAGELATTEPKYEATRNAAAVALAIMDRLVGKAVVVLKDPPSGTRVEVSGRAVALDRLGRSLPVEAGEVILRVSAPNKQPVEQTAEVAAGESHVFTVVLEDAATGAVPPAPEPTGGEVRVAGWVILGVGAASLVAFGVTGGMALSEYNTIADECGGVRCSDLSYGDAIDRGTTLRTVANVTAVVGAVAATAGLAMVIFGGPSDPAEPTVGFAVTPEGGVLQLAHRF